MQDLVTVAVDAQGGDGGPEPDLEGIAMALEEDPSLLVLACGQPRVIDDFVDAHERCIGLPCGEPILMGEHPAQAVRTKRDSSIVLGCKAVKDGLAQGFFSTGSTGACLVSATLNIGRIKGVKRPAIGVMVPSDGHPTLLLDVGANSDCKPEYLVQFAKMGSVYVRRVLGVEDPRIGLLNIGTEESKGSVLVQEAYERMSRHVSGFRGNCESKAMLRGDFDVVVTDGFTGNVCLKTMEATASMVMGKVKGALVSSIKAKLGALMVKGALMRVKEELDPDEFGGSPLLGVNGVCIIGHGSSGPVAVKNGILAAAREIRADVASDIREAIDGRDETVA